MSVAGRHPVRRQVPGRKKPAMTTFLRRYLHRALERPNLDQGPSPSGKPGVRANLEGVVALSPDDAWAAGSQHADRNRLVFVLHWNGRTWRKVHSPTPGMGGNLLGIGASSPDNVWAVGQGSVNGGCPAGCQPSIVHGTGSRWNVVTDPAGLRGGLNILFTVAATSARNAWAVGTSGYGGDHGSSLERPRLELTRFRLTEKGCSAMRVR